MEAASKNQPGSAVMEVRLESSTANIGFSETCPICGNRKRRCLLPPTRSRKKRLEEVSPSYSPTRPVLLRSESSPLPSSRSAGLSVMPSQPPHLRSHSFPSGRAPFGRTVDPALARNPESAAEVFRSPPPTVAPPFLHPSPPPLSPPSCSVPAPPDRWLKRSKFNKSPLAAETELANDKKVSEPEAVMVSITSECKVKILNT